MSELNWKPTTSVFKVRFLCRHKVYRDECVDCAAYEVLEEKDPEAYLPTSHFIVQKAKVPPPAPCCEILGSPKPRK